jgi:hypothetical protein
MKHEHPRRPNRHDVMPILHVRIQIEPTIDVRASATCAGCHKTLGKVEGFTDLNEAVRRLVAVMKVCPRATVKEWKPNPLLG